MSIWACSSATTLLGFGRAIIRPSVRQGGKGYGSCCRCKRFVCRIVRAWDSAAVVRWRAVSLEWPFRCLHAKIPSNPRRPSFRWHLPLVFLRFCPPRVLLRCVSCTQFGTCAPAQSTIFNGFCRLDCSYAFLAKPVALLQHCPFQLYQSRELDLMPGKSADAFASS